MHKTFGFGGVVAASGLASVLSMAALSFVQSMIAPEPAFAQGSDSRDVVLYAAPRSESGDNESFIFYDQKSGDIWVYRDRKIREHYRLRELGIDLEEIDVDRSTLRVN